MGLVVSLFIMFFAWSFVFDIGTTTLGPMFAGMDLPPFWGGGLAVFLVWYLLGVALQYGGIFLWGQIHQEMHMRRVLRADRLAHQAAIEQQQATMQQAAGEAPTQQKKRGWGRYWYVPVILAITILGIVSEWQ